MHRGKLIVFSGPSGVGKDSIRKKIKFNDFIFSVSLTTREKRAGEIDGKHYHFVSEEYFKSRINENKMLEYANFVGNYYGTDLDFVQKQLEKGNNVFLEIECKGAMQVIDSIDDVLSIFILPPTIEDLEERLKKRNTEDLETIMKRIDKARHEIKLKEQYQYNIVNDNLEKAVNQLDQILETELRPND